MSEEYKPFELVNMANNNRTSCSSACDEAQASGDITVSIDSTYVEQISYGLYSRSLSVIINGSSFDYYPVSLHSFIRFVNSESKGQFYNKYVKGRW